MQTRKNVENETNICCSHVLITAVKNKQFVDSGIGNCSVWEWFLFTTRLELYEVEYVFNYC